MKKGLKFVATLCATAVMGTSFITAGCGNNVPDTEQTMEVFACKLGFGVKWLDDLLEAFKQEDWVKEKYPNLEIVFDYSDDRSAISTRLAAGAGKNTVDIIMSDNVIDYVGQDLTGKEYSCNLTDVVYKTQVPGENITVLDKLQPSFRKSLYYYTYGDKANLDGEANFKAYDFNWASSMFGWIYNVELLSRFGYDTPPRTSDEFIEACETITKNKTFYNKGYAIMWSSKADFRQYLYDLMWGQYEGYDNYYNYFLGVNFDGEDYSENSSDIFNHVGRREALSTMIDIVSTESGYSYSKGGAVDFKAAQRYFLRGEGVFTFDGDWFETEMQEGVAASDYTFRFMKTPIISTIINTTPTINDDDTLRDVISKIDEGYATVAEAGLSGVSQADYDKILKARSIAVSIGPGLSTCIPIYANGKQVAFDFLRFMATDKAQRIYMIATGGGSLPFQYDVKEKAPEIYDNFSDIQKSRLEMANESVHGITILPYYSSLPLVKFGSLGLWSSYAMNTTIPINYARAGTRDSSKPESAQAAFDRDIEYWTGNNAQKWKKCLTDAGYGK